jgi:hypothetical protein
MTKQRWGTTAAVVAVVVGGVFLGFYNCGAYIWVRELAGVLTLSAVAIGLALRLSLPASHQLLFVVVLAVLYRAGLVVGAALYMPPSSLSQALRASC